jgi:hypothetical protein
MKVEHRIVATLALGIVAVTPAALMSQPGMVAADVRVPRDSPVVIHGGALQLPGSDRARYQPGPPGAWEPTYRLPPVPPPGIDPGYRPLWVPDSYPWDGFKAIRAPAHWQW